jgi:hypothetical protein
MVPAPGIPATRSVPGGVHNALKNEGTTQLAIRATTTQGDITARSLWPTGPRSRSGPPDQQV